MSGKVNVKMLKAKLALSDYEAILKAIGIPIFSKSDKQWVLWTGEKNKDPYNGSPKLYFYTDSKVFMSYTSACSMDIIGLVQKRLNVLGENCTFIDAINVILSATGLDPNAVQRVNKNKNAYDWQSKLERYIRFKSTGADLPIYNTHLRYINTFLSARMD